MPFLFVFPKPTDAPPRDQPGAADRLTALLCPYRGPVQRIELAHGQLYLSSLAEITPTGVAIPARTRKNPQTAWLEIRIDDHGVHFETDPLGTFPLWYAEDDARLIVTSEVKSVLALDGFEVGFEPERWPADRKRPPDYSPYANVRRVSPGANLHVTPALETREQRRPTLDYQPAALLASDEERQAGLDTALLASARAMAAADGPWGAFLSGGIDSSMATALMMRSHADLRTFTLGTEYGNEYAEAEALASFLGTEHARVTATEPDAVAHFERAVFCNETIDGLTAETLAQLSVLAQAAAAGVRRVVTGYGADLLFGSMLRHQLYLQVTGVDDLQSLIERTCWSGEFAPFYAWALGIEVHHLFWDPQLMNCAFQIPAAASFDGTREKLVLRTLAVERGYMNQDHAFRTKQALTDGTQFNRLLSVGFGLGDRYAYDEKSARAVAVLRRVFETGPPPR